MIFPRGQREVVTPFGGVTCVEARGYFPTCQSQKRGTTMFNGHNGVNGNGDKALNSQYASALAKEWKENPRWQGVTRPYTPEDVLRLRGSIQIEYTLARLGAQRLWDLLHTDAYVAALG